MPRSLTPVNATDTTVTLSWMPPNMTNGIITEYQIQYKIRNSNSSLSNISLLPNATMIYTVTGLLSSNEYEFRVRASTRVGYGLDDIVFYSTTSKFSGNLLFLNVKCIHFKMNIACIGVTSSPCAYRSTPIV